MSDLEYLFEYIKQCHDAKDIAEMKDIVCDLEQLEQFYQQGNQNAIVQLVQRVVAKHQSEADEHDKGQPPAQNRQLRQAEVLLSGLHHQRPGRDMDHRDQGRL